MRRTRLSAVLVVAAAALAGCAGAGSRSMPACRADERLAIVAQSVPAAAYVPCIKELPTGWSFTGLDVDDHGATITLASDRADRDVDVTLTATCTTRDATPIAPRDEGVRTYQLVESIDPRYAGRVIDVFPGGCVVSSYDFQRGPHVGLITDLLRAVDLYSRRQLRQELHARFDITLDP